MTSTKKFTSTHWHKVLCFFALVLFMGCGSRVTYVNGDLPDFKPNNFRLRHHAVGFIQLNNPLPIWQICRNGFSRIDSREIFAATYMASGATRGIWTMTLTYVQCKNNTAYLLKIDENGAVSEIAATQPIDEES